jgi:DNA-directed RNA polymerase subunit RPC12/RpoP
MTRYICTSCNFRFEPKAGKEKPTACPYCGKKGTLVEEKGAQELLDEATRTEDADY